MRAGSTVRLVRSAVSAASQTWSRYSHQFFSCGLKVSRRFAVAYTGTVIIMPVGKTS
jgi:hypothetical protein